MTSIFFMLTETNLWLTISKTSIIKTIRYLRTRRFTPVSCRPAILCLFQVRFSIAFSSKTFSSIDRFSASACGKFIDWKNSLIFTLRKFDQKSISAEISSIDRKTIPSSRRIFFRWTFARFSEFQIDSSWKKLYLSVCLHSEEKQNVRSDLRFAQRISQITVDDHTCSAWHLI